MIQLPDSEEIDIASLSRIFKDTTNSYKFYWFLAILDSLQENGERQMLMKDLSLRMLANVWYPLDYYKLSFGSQDGFKKVASFITSKIKIDNSINSPSLLQQILGQFKEVELFELSLETDKLIRWVPYRFLRPFFANETKGIPDTKVNNYIQRSSGDFFLDKPQSVVYRILSDSIELTPLWTTYFLKNQILLRGFVYWHLVQFLQKNNPNIIGLTEKLEKPKKRDLVLANRFWKGYLAENSSIKCIYSGQQITDKNLSLDHFLPWSYVAHDQIWNIIPTPKSVNSSKSNCLPSFDLYFEAFSNLQYQAVRFYLEKQNERILEDYVFIFKANLADISLSAFEENLRKQFLPHFQTAKNMGFFYPYVY